MIELRLFRFTLTVLCAACCVFSIEERFEDVLLGEIEPSGEDFPFLQPVGSARNTLVYPNSQQMISLISDSLNNEKNTDKNFELFETFRRYLGQFLSSSYRQRSQEKLHKGFQIAQETYSFTPIIVTATEINDIANDVLRKRDGLPEVDGSGEVESSQHQQADEQRARYPVNFPKLKAVQEVRSCLSNQGNTGAVEFKKLDGDVTEFTSFRVSCLRVKSHFFAAIGMVHIVYRKTSQNNGANDGNIRRSVQTLADFMLRNHVANNFRYPYMLDVERYWTATPAPTDRTTTEIEDESTTAELSPAPIGEEETPRRAVKKDGISTFRGRLDYGRQIVVRGTPAVDASRFVVDLNQGDGYIGLHISVRFDDPKDERVVVRNVMREYVYEEGKEERDGPFPFESNVPFKLKISCEDEGYRIEVNDQPFASFKHRLDARAVDSVSVKGSVKDVIVADVQSIAL